MFSLSLETKALQGAATPASEKSTNWARKRALQAVIPAMDWPDPVPWKATTLIPAFAGMTRSKARVHDS